MLVKKLKQIAFRVTEEGNKKEPDQKVYMILLFLNDETKTFELVYTREEAFQICLEHMNDADIVTSQVMTNKHTMENCISIYSFIRGTAQAHEELAVNSELDMDELNETVVQLGKDPEELWKEDMGEE